MKHKIKIEFEEEGTLEEILKCKTCKKPLVQMGAIIRGVEPSLYKFDCKCLDESVRVSVG